MKKLLLSISLFASLVASSQVAFTEDCATMTVGNVGTSTGGAVAGQNNWYTLVSTAAVPAGQNTDFQVINSGSPNGNALKIFGSASAATTTTSQGRGMWRDVSTEWSFRDAGKDIAILEYDLFTGPVSTSYNTLRSYIFNASGKAVAGLYYAPGPISPTAATPDLTTGVIRGWAYVDNTASSGGVVGYYTYRLGVDNTTTPPSAVDVVLTPNTWYKVGVSFDYNTGLVTWKGANGLIDSDDTGSIPGEIGLDIAKVQYNLNSATGNTSATTATFDNIEVRFDSTNTLLALNNTPKIAESKISVYPNPAKNNVTVSSIDFAINNVEISDINGRVIKNITLNNSNESQISISELNSGIYMMKITSDNGVTTKKLIKE